MAMRKTLASLVILISSILIVSCGSINDKSSKPKKGYFAPDFTLKSVDGKEYTLSRLRGKVVYVNIWATWCPPCRDEMPSMVKFFNRFKREGVDILAVSVDKDVDAVKKFIKKYNVTFPVLLDPEQKVYKLYNATAVPETHLVDKLGIIRDTMIGPFDWTRPGNINSVKELISE